jgi:hypothetical protein
LPKVPEAKRAKRGLSNHYPNLAEKDVKLIAGNLLGVGKKVQERNPKAKQSRQMRRRVTEAVQRLKQKKDNTGAEVSLLEFVKSKASADHYKIRRARKQEARK